MLGTPLALVSGDFYRLCWSHDPANETDFNVELDGTFSIFGTLETNHTCTLGVLCALSLQGTGLAVANELQIRIVGDNAGCRSELNGTESEALVSMSPISPTAAELAVFRFGVLTEAAAGSGYALCWDASPQSPLGAADYRVEVGRLTL